MKRKNLIQKLCFLLGLALMLAALLLSFFWWLSLRQNEARAQEYVHSMKALLPRVQSAVPEERRDNAMSVLSLEGTDFIGLLEMPRYDSALPVCASWGQSSKYPCCLSGSVYDGSIQIGTTTHKWQYGFYREISVGDALYFTDAEGNRFAYTVSDIRYEKHVDQTALQRVDADLTLFIKNVHAFEYITVFCTA